jgi:hypothetical protein
MFNQNMFTDDDCKKIWVCGFCGEEAKKSQKYCDTCKTQSARKKIFDENAEIFKQNAKLGFKIPATMPSWK